LIPDNAGGHISPRRWAGIALENHLGFDFYSRSSKGVAEGPRGPAVSGPLWEARERGLRGCRPGEGEGLDRHQGGPATPRPLCLPLKERLREPPVEEELHPEDHAVTRES
jgi:hypothetical protein